MFNNIYINSMISLKFSHVVMATQFFFMQIILKPPHQEMMKKIVLLLTISIQRIR